MVSQVYGPQHPVCALVVDNDPTARQKICSILAQKGIEVNEASSLTQGRQCFDSQPIVLARSPGDGSELSGFVDWVRLRAGNHQPYIVAIDDGERTEDAMEDAASNPGCNAVMHAPVGDEEFEERLKAIDAWLESRASLEQGNAVPGTKQSPPSPELSELSELSARNPLPVPIALIAKPNTRDQHSAYASILVENAPMAMAMFDEQMRYLVANRKWNKEFHLENVSLNGRSHYEVFPSLPENWRKLFERCLAEGVGERCQEDLFERPDGTTDWVRWEVRPWRRAEGAIGGLIITSEVITDLRMRERRSRFEREFTASLLNSGSAPVMLVDFTGHVVQQNFASMALFQPAGSRNGQSLYWDLITAPDEVEGEREAFLQSVETLRDTGRYEAPAAQTLTQHVQESKGKGNGSGNGNADEAVRRFAWSTVPHVNENGVVEAFIKVGIELGAGMADIPTVAPAEETEPEPELRPLSTEALPVAVGGLTREEWKAKEKALVDQRDFFEQIPENAPLGMMLVDREGRVLYSNPQHKAVIGFDVAESSDIEEWLLRGCPDEQYAEEVLEAWRENIWRKQLPKIFTLATEEGLLKEIEFQPALLADGNLLLTFSDVTESYRIEEAFRASEAKFRAFFQGSRVGMALVDKSGDFFDINAALETMLGYPRWEMRSRSLSGCLYPDDMPAFEGLERAIAEDDPSVNEIEVRLIEKEGALLWVRLNASPVRDHAGELLFTAYTIHDISPQKRACRERDGNRGRTRAVLDLMPDLVLLFDENGVIADMIPSSKKFLALDPDRVLREGIGQDLPKLEENLSALILEARESERGTARFDFTATGEDDETRHLEARVVNCDDGHTLVMVGDIADRDASQENLARKALAFASVTDAIVMTDVKGRVTDINAAAERFFGYEESEIAGKPLYTLYDPTNPRVFNRRISEEINSKKCWSGETRFRRKDGSEGTCEVHYVPSASRGGEARSLVGIVRPVEEKSGAAVETPVDAEAAADVNEQIQKALSGVHHRVNNDLQVISSLLNLQLGALPDQMGRRVLKQHQNRIQTIAFIHHLLERSGERDTVDFSKFMVSLVEYLGESFGVDENVIEVHLTFGDLRIAVDQAVPLGLIANELLSNAFQHAFPGGREGIVRLGFERVNGDGLLKISDNGVGLPMAFDLEASPTLGLQVVKILVKQLDGGIELADSPDTEFHVRFPAGAG